MEKEKSAEELYQEFREMGYTHIQAREFALKALALLSKPNE